MQEEARASFGGCGAARAVALACLSAFLLACGGVFSLYDEAGAQEKAFSWPHSFVVEGWVVQVHAPSLESVSDTRLKGRSRVSISKSGNAPSSGSAWFTASISTDQQARLIRVLGVQVDHTQIPDLAPAEARAIAAVIESQVGSAGIVLPLDRVLANVPAETPPSAAKQDRATVKQGPAATGNQTDGARTER